jgi:hypothetical protein
MNPFDGSQKLIKEMAALYSKIGEYGDKPGLLESGAGKRKGGSLE